MDAGSGRHTGRQDNLSCADFGASSLAGTLVVFTTSLASLAGCGAKSTPVSATRPADPIFGSTTREVSLDKPDPLERSVNRRPLTIKETQASRAIVTGDITREALVYLAAQGGSFRVVNTEDGTVLASFDAQDAQIISISPRGVSVAGRRVSGALSARNVALELVPNSGSFQEQVREAAPHSR